MKLPCQTFLNSVLLIEDKETLMINFSFWSNKVDMPGPERAARPLSWHFAGAAKIAVLYRTDGWSQQETCEVIPKVIFGA